MKKRLSLLMVLMMVLSLVPMSVFATAGSMPGGLVKIDDTDEDTFKKVTVKLTQAAGTELTTGGEAKLTLNKGEFAQDSKIDELLADGKITASQANTYKTERSVEFDFGNELNAGIQEGKLYVGRDGFDGTAYVEIPTIVDSNRNVVNSRLPKEIDIYVTFWAFFDEESAGDITLSVEEMYNPTYDKDSGLDVAKPIVIGTVAEGTGDDMKMTVEDAETKISFDGGSLSELTIKDIDKNNGVETLELEFPDYIRWEIAANKTTISLGGIAVNPKGTAVTGTLSPREYEVVNDYTLKVNVTGFEKLQLKVEPEVTVKKRDASKGDITLKVTAKNADGSKLEKIDGVVGKITDFDVTIKAWEKGKKEIPAIYGGDDATVKVKLAGVVGSFTKDREIDFTVKGADVEYNSLKGYKNLDFVSGDKDGEKYDDGEFTLKVSKDREDELEFELKLKADWAQNGPVTLIADSRDFGKIEAEIAKVTPAYTVETKVTTIKKGESLATADIVIKEAKAGILDTDKYLVLNLNDRSRGTMTFGADYKIEATNGMKVEDGLYAEDGSTRKDLDTMAIEIKTSSSKEAATITISNVMVKVDGATVDGEKAINTYVVEKGDQATDKDDKAVGPKVSNKATAAEYALSKEADLDPDYEVNYVNVVKEYGTVATTTVFKIGSKEYTVNGETKTANEAPYVSGKGYTMLPVRAIGEALGLKADWNASTKTATFSNDSKVASVVIGADTMYVNGTPFKLAAKAEIKNGSTFVELRSLASAFGVKLEWDAATKSVTIQG